MYLVLDVLLYMYAPVQVPYMSTQRRESLCGGWREGFIFSEIRYFCRRFHMQQLLPWPFLCETRAALLSVYSCLHLVELAGFLMWWPCLSGSIEESCPGLLVWGHLVHYDGQDMGAGGSLAVGASGSCLRTSHLGLLSSAQPHLKHPYRHSQWFIS